MSWYGDALGHAQAAALGWMKRGIRKSYSEIQQLRQADKNKSNKTKNLNERNRAEKIKLIVKAFAQIHSFDNDEDIDSEEETAIDSAIDNALAYYGDPYGGDGVDEEGNISHDGVDCSALVMNSYSQFIDLERTVEDQITDDTVSEKIEDIKKTRRGNLIYFYKPGTQTIDHVGLVSGNINDEIYFIHASSSRGTMLSNISDYDSKTTFWKDHTAQIRRPKLKKTETNKN